MATLEARLQGALQGPQVTSDKLQVPRESAAEPVEDDVVVASTEPTAANGIAALPSDDTAPWPGSTDESSFLAEQRVQGVVPPVGPASEPTDLSPLPSLDELVQRIPAEARAALDDLFRAKFSGVRRISKKSLKT
jgi:hypothetical protein